MPSLQELEPMAVLAAHLGKRHHSSGILEGQEDAKRRELALVTPIASFTPLSPRLGESMCAGAQGKEVGTILG